jgi:predicted permease
VGFVYFGGLAFVLGAVSATVFARGRRETWLLVAVGAAVALAYFGYEWAQAPANSEEADYSCSDCGQWLGRYWEGWLVLFIAITNWLGWTAGVAVGAGLRRAQRARRELRQQRGATSSRH